MSLPWPLLACSVVVVVGGGRVVVGNEIPLSVRCGTVSLGWQTTCWRSTLIEPASEWPWPHDHMYSAAESYSPEKGIADQDGATTYTVQNKVEAAGRYRHIESHVHHMHAHGTQADHDWPWSLQLSLLRP